MVECINTTIIRQKPPYGRLLLKDFVLATSYSRLTTTIASTGLNCGVRNENRCDPSDKSPEQKLQLHYGFRKRGWSNVSTESRTLTLMTVAHVGTAWLSNQRFLELWTLKSAGYPPFRNPQSKNMSQQPNNDIKYQVLEQSSVPGKKHKSVDPMKAHCAFSRMFPTFQCRSSDRRISTPRLNALLQLHLAPINVVISHGSITIPYLRVGFPLRCFQRLSIPNIATGRCSWRNSPQTRGSFISVLSY